MTYNPAAIGFALVALPICYTLALAALPVGMEIPHFPQFALTSLPRSADRVLLMPRRRKGEGGKGKIGMLLGLRIFARIKGFSQNLSLF